jgi:hypothetical protein
MRKEDETSIAFRASRFVEAHMFCRCGIPIRECLPEDISHPKAKSFCGRCKLLIREEVK